MHGTLPATEEAALASLRDRATTQLDAIALAEEWRWTLGKVRHRLAKWRRDGALPPADRRRSASRNGAASEVVM